MISAVICQAIYSASTYRSYSLCIFKGISIVGRWYGERPRQDDRKDSAQQDTRKFFFSNSNPCTGKRDTHHAVQIEICQKNVQYFDFYARSSGSLNQGYMFGFWSISHCIKHSGWIHLWKVNMDDDLYNENQEIQEMSSAGKISNSIFFL